MNKDKYLKIGKKELSSGITSNLYWDFRELEQEDIEVIRDFLKKRVSKRTKIVGIKTMGWEIVKTLPNGIFYDPKKNILSESIEEEGYIILDDVITTGKTLAKCIKKIGREPMCVYCLKNRLNIIEIK